MKIGSIILLAILAVVVDAQPRKPKTERKQQRRLRSASRFADITEDLEQPLMDKIKHRYEAGMLELPPQQKSRALKSSKKQAMTFVESVPETSDRDVVLVGDVSDTRDMSMSSTSMSMSMDMSMSMPMSMSMSMPMSMSMSL